MPVITLTGPTCAGKSSIERELQALGCGRAISHTTRAPRQGEVDGVAYHFVSDQEYEALKAAGEFVETIELGTRKYAMSGYSIRQAQSVSENVAIVVDPHGAEQIISYCHEHRLPTLSVWVDCNMPEQARRWVSRTAVELMAGADAVGSAAERLGIMLGQESEWRENARRDRILRKYSYQYRISESGTQSPEFWAKSILSVAKKS